MILVWLRVQNLLLPVHNSVCPVHLYYLLERHVDMNYTKILFIQNSPLFQNSPKDKYFSYFGRRLKLIQISSLRLVHQVFCVL